MKKTDKTGNIKKQLVKQFDRQVFLAKLDAIVTYKKLLLTGITEVRKFDEEMLEKVNGDDDLIKITITQTYKFLISLMCDAFVKNGDFTQEELDEYIDEYCMNDVMGDVTSILKTKTDNE